MVTCTWSQVRGRIKTDLKACSIRMDNIQLCAGVLYKPYINPNYIHFRNPTELVENLKYEIKKTCLKCNQFSRKSLMLFKTIPW